MPAELEADPGVDLVAPGRAGEFGVGLEVAGQREGAQLAGAGHDGHGHGATEAAADAGSGGAQQRGRSVVPRRQPTGGQPVHQRSERDDRGHVGAVRRRREHVPARQRHTPQHQAGGVDAGQAYGGRHRRAVVLDLAREVDPLARRTTRGAEAAVVECEHVDAALGQAVGEGFEAGVLGAAEAVRHHHDGPAVGAGQLVGAGDVERVELGVADGDPHAGTSP